MNNTPGSAIVDGAAGIIWLAALTQYLPAIAAALSAVWFLIRIIESRSFQAMLGNYAWVRRDNKTADKEDSEL